MVGVINESLLKQLKREARAEVLVGGGGGIVDPEGVTTPALIEILIAHVEVIRSPFGK